MPKAQEEQKEESALDKLTRMHAEALAELQNWQQRANHLSGFLSEANQKMLRLDGRLKCLDDLIAEGKPGPGPENPKEGKPE